MKIPKPTKLPSGSWNIRLRLGGESISITELTEQECIKKAQLVKAEHLAGKREAKIEESSMTLKQGIDMYLSERRSRLSPSSIRKYENIKNNHWPDLMDKPMNKITSRQWECSISKMMGEYAYKTVKVSVGLVKTVALYYGAKFPSVRIKKTSSEKARQIDKCKFLEPQEILIFVKEAAKTKHAIPLLLALSSLRISEIDGLDWSNVVFTDSEVTIHIRRIRIMDENNNWIYKDGAKTEGSVRNVPVFIPELQSALESERKQHGKLMKCHQETLRRACDAVCKNAGVPNPGIHGLRHSFASLCASDRVRIPEHISQEIGGWQNDRVMKEIYTHVANSDKESCLDRLRLFYKSNASD